MDFKHRCSTCANQGTFNDGSPGCGKFKIKIDLNKDFCSWHKNNDTQKCIFCNNTDDLILIQTDNDVVAVCSEHYNVYYSCKFCRYSTQCGFAQDQSEPAYVMKQVQQGPMILQQQVKNPNLVQRHCSKCRCSLTIDAQVVCGKDYQDYACQSWHPQR